MLATQSGSIRLFRFSGIQVYLHWSWFVVALIEISWRRSYYSSPIWNAAEYLALFAIVTLHEFGHALACRSVGGKAEQIVLWPLGGIAFVSPPMRPGAVLWSIAAGPLVNVILLPVLFGLAFVGAANGWNHDLGNFVAIVAWINWSLLKFNLLPVYPLDGGQILQSLLWFRLGRVRSLFVSALLGLISIPLLWIWLGMANRF
jgi:Zn-dependent protease